MGCGASTQKTDVQVVTPPGPVVVEGGKTEAETSSSGPAEKAVAPAPAPVESAVPAVEAPLVAGVTAHDTGSFDLPDGGGGAGEKSWLFVPSAAKDGAAVPAVVMVHGTSAEGEKADAILDAMYMDMGVRVGEDLDWTWSGMKDVAAAVAEQGFAVLMICTPEGDEHKYEELAGSDLSQLLNAWPMADYSKFLSAAVDHLLAVAPKHGVSVDASRVGLVGHSMGGGGVLYAGAKDCKDKVAAVVSLNPGCYSIERPYDKMAGVEKFSTGAKHSGEHGEGEMLFLADLKVPTYVYSSQAEYNTQLIPGGGATVWPIVPSIFAQIGATKKEMYVDNLVDNPIQVAHVWLYGHDNLRSYGDGVPLAAMCSFLRRHVAKSEEETVMDKPANAKEWEVVTG